MRDTPLENSAPRTAPHRVEPPPPLKPKAAATRARRMAFAALTLLLLVYVTFEALRPEPPSRGDLMHLDKVLHVAAFATLALSARLTAGKGARALVAVSVALLLYGAAIEVVQGFIPGREASVLDLLADGAGIAAGLLLCSLAWRLKGLVKPA